MNTILFVEREENKHRMVVDFQLGKQNYFYAPKGLIRVARFENNFNPKQNHGYYGDIYLRKFIRIWKTKTFINIQRKKDINNANSILHKKFIPDIVYLICQFL